MHYIAMNRFKVGKENGAAFEAVWLNREVHLTEVPGFVEFHLLRGAENTAEGYRLYASHTVWRSEEDFEAWTKSQSFRDAHKNAGDHTVMYKGHPQFEGFTAVEGA